MKKNAFLFICLLLLLRVDAHAEGTSAGNEYVKIDKVEYFQFVEDVKQLETKAHDLLDLNNSLEIECERLADENKLLSDKVQYAQIQNRRLVITICVMTPIAVSLGFVSNIIWNNYYELRK